MSTRIGVWLLSALLLFYLVLAGRQAVIMIATGDPVVAAMGVALVVLPAIGFWALVRELAFGLRSTRLAATLEREDGLPQDAVPVRPSGRAERMAADALFPEYRAAAEAAPDDWRAWFRLGIVYDAAGDRRRARQAIRHAIALERAARG